MNFYVLRLFCAISYSASVCILQCSSRRAKSSLKHPAHAQAEKLSLALTRYKG